MDYVRPDDPALVPLHGRLRRPHLFLLSDAGAQLLTDEATARDFVVDAFAHCKFIAHTAAARPLLEKAGTAERDKGVIELHEPGDAASFVEACRGLRLWEGEAKVKRI